ITGFGTVVLDTQETAADVTVTGAGPSATIALTGDVDQNGDVGPNVTWTLTVDGTAFTTKSCPGQTLNDIANALRDELLKSGNYVVPALAAGSSTLTISRADGASLEASLALSTRAAGSDTTTANSVSLDMEGVPTQGEIWTLTIASGSGAAHSYQYAVLYGDTLSDIADGLGKQLPVGTYNVSVLGRVLTISGAQGQTVTVSLTVSDDSEGGAVVTQQLVFDASDWDVAQHVTVEALDDNIVDGHDALVFAPLPGTTDQIRGPVIIDGGVGINSEPFLNNPLMLPGETNLPLPDGTILGNGGTDTSGNGTVTDPNATNLNQTTGQRPGFDPRMNQFPYTIEFLSGADKGVTFDVGSVSQDILSIGNTTPFQVSVSTDGAYTFIGTPAQTMSVEAENGQGLETTSLNGLAGLMWTQASIALTGLPSVGDTWTITLDGHPYSYVVQNGDQVASLVAEQLAKLLANPPAGDNLPSWNVQVRVSLTGDATLIITCGAGSECTGGAFTAGFDEVAAKGTDAGAIATLTGTPQTIGTTSWTMAAVEVTSAGTRWSISAGGSVIASCGVTGAPSCGTSIAGTLQKLDQQVPSNYLPLISGTTVTLATGWSVGSQGAIVPAGGTEYVI